MSASRLRRDFGGQARAKPERSGGQKEKELEGGDFARPRFRRRQISFQPRWQAAFYKIINPKITDAAFAIKDTINALESFNCKN